MLYFSCHFIHSGDSFQEDIQVEREYKKRTLFAFFILQSLIKKVLFCIGSESG